MGARSRRRRDAPRISGRDHADYSGEAPQWADGRYPSAVPRSNRPLRRPARAPARGLGGGGLSQAGIRSAKLEAFAGFPTSGLATVVPNTFFSNVLPQIDTPEELVVSVYFFFVQNLKRRHPRYVTRRELE